LIEQFSSSHESEDTYRLAAFSDALMRVLLERGISVEAARLTAEALRGVGEVRTADEAISLCFQPSEAYPTPFPRGRFGDGTYPVCYSALEIETSIEEVAHHQKKPINELRHPRYFRILRCSFSGVALVLVGHEQSYPDLISPTESGYPFCRSLAGEARGAGHDALRTPSARRPGGICLPVFTESTLTDRVEIGEVEMAPDGAGGVRKRQL
jgi:hypothetical protein